MKNKRKSIICEIIAGMVSHFFWGLTVLYLLLSNWFYSMFDDIGGELPLLTQIVMNHLIVAFPLIVSIFVFLLSYIPPIRSNRLRNALVKGLSMAIALINLALCTYGACAPLFDMADMVG